MKTIASTVLDPSRRSGDARDFEGGLRRKIVGQDAAVEKVVEIYQMFLAGLNVLIFHSSKIYRNMHEWEWAENPPAAAKLAGWISLISWGIVIIAGRTTAYNF